MSISDQITAYESCISRTGNLSPGIADRDVDGDEESPDELPAPTPEQIDQFCAEDVRDLFADWWSDMPVRYRRQQFAEKVWESWAKYAERHGIRKDRDFGVTR